MPNPTNKREEKIADSTPKEREAQAEPSREQRKHGSSKNPS
jgi:hypothetical protein